MNKHKILACIQDFSSGQGVGEDKLPDHVDRDSNLALLLRECSLPPVDDKLFRALHSCLEQQEDIKDHFTGYIRIGNGGRVLGLDELAAWLLAQNGKGHLSDALFEIERIIQTNTGSGYFAAAFLGASAATELQVCNACSLIPISNLPLSKELDLFKLPKRDENQFSFMLPYYYCSTAVLVKYDVDPLIIPNSRLESWHIDKHPNEKAIDAEQLAYDVLDALVLDGPRPLLIIHEWHGLCETIPYAELGINRSYISHEINPSRASTYWSVELDPQLDTVKAYLKLGEEVKRKLRIPIDRLNLAILKRHSIDCPIELGICFESLLLDNEKAELTYRLRQRGQYLSKGSLEEKLKVGKQLGLFYDLRSKVIHTGKGKELKTVDDWTRHYKEIDDWIRLAGRLITNAIRNGGIPVWEKLVLSSKPDAD